MLRTGQTVEAALTLRLAARTRPHGRRAGRGRLRSPRRAALRAGGGVPRNSRSGRRDDVWLGPPIFDGCPQRPYDQLIPRPLGLNVLARKRFTWSNEDFCLWRLTGKQRYLESGVKKAFALLGTQNEHGGWYEGIEFYNLPPHHHHMYDTYISGIFLLEAYDVTGDEGFLERRAARQATSGADTRRRPTATSRSRPTPGGTAGAATSTSSATPTSGACSTRTAARRAFLRPACRAHRRRAGSGRRAARPRRPSAGASSAASSAATASSCTASARSIPTLERPGDPPYIKLDLVPQIEDVYTVASSYRLMLANRIARATRS